MNSRFGAAIAFVLLAASCGGPQVRPDHTPFTIEVGAAASLTTVVPEIAAAFEPGHHVTVRSEFAGTDAVAAQVEQGAPIDVFLGASTKYDDRLSSEGLIDPPVAFATNRLVLIVPASNPAAIGSVRDLTKPGVKLVIGSATVPAGAYARSVLTNLAATYGAGVDGLVLANVVSQEPSVESVLSKVRLGEADAGFVYVTDAMAAGSAVKVIDLPSEAQAVAVYPAAAVRSSTHLAEARAFVRFLLTQAAQALLRQAGFGPPPASPPPASPSSGG